MAGHANQSPGIPEYEFIITRTFDAPRELVFRAWTECEHLKRWWGSRESRMSVCKLDLRTGGLFHYCLESPDGDLMWGRFSYREIARPERLVFVNSFSDESGGITRAPFNPDWPLEPLNTLIFEVQEGRTLFTLRAKPINATAAEREAFKAGHDSLQQGWAATFSQLEAHLASI